MNQSRVCCLYFPCSITHSCRPPPPCGSLSRDPTNWRRGPMFDPRIVAAKGASLSDYCRCCVRKVENTCLELAVQVVHDHGRLRMLHTSCRGRLATPPICQ
ncbi:hypothetical protein NDU88_004965 [Pleurodeles waltl]|uniref:Uncharacterized protein n=1 Tax=Pleurodeles waltl TaxID=8319 RepID=A0AAV7PJ28_PLEWA|nr:hypothetical protein NDU88_004965 [Pleurodeles waltl]